MRLNTLLMSLLLAAAILAGCKKEPVPENPFAKQVSGRDSVETPPDPLSITGLHKNILSVKCNNPGCHDGTFEPDFRTVQSSYSTLVYKKVVKTTVGGTQSFTYRVVPYDTASSFLHERLVTPGSDYMPSNGVRLSREQISQINAWIMNGARDMNGNTAPEPDDLPQVKFYAAFDALGKRLDTIRVSNKWEEPFYADKNQPLVIWFLAEDDKTPVENYTVNELKLSTDPQNFSSASTYTGIFKALGNFKFWEFTLSTSSFSPGSTVYFRYRVSDGRHGSAVTEYPNSNMELYFLTNASFYIRP
jgi:hypothetical protein